MRKFFAVLVLLVLSTVLFAQTGTTPTFKISSTYGNIPQYKPSLANRLSGVKNVVLCTPNNPGIFDNYIFGAISDYLRSIGLNVTVSPLTTCNFKQSQVSGLTVFDRFCSDPFPIPNNINTLTLIADWRFTSGRYVEGASLRIAFFDLGQNILNFLWNVNLYDIPTKNSEKLIRLLRENIMSYRSYNPSYSYNQPSITSNWNERILREYLSKNYSDPLEGIYKSDIYTLGVKKADNGIYYIIYLSGAGTDSDWREGDIKAILNNTASPILFKADWYGRWKQIMKFDIQFSEFGFVAQNKEENDSYVKMYPTAQMIAEAAKKNQVSSGTGFLLSKDGYVITNHHVIEDANTIKITGINNNYSVYYKATVEVTDPQNDLAILKIKDEKFKPVLSIPYSFKFNTSNVGEDCFVLGYPLISSMGTDIKLTTGIISSKTGYKGTISDYQISAAVQPGNSGAPLFDKSGNIIGVVKAKHNDAENAGYAVKASYIRNLVELLPTPLNLSYPNQLANKTLPQQVELASKAVCIIIVNE